MAGKEFNHSRIGVLALQGDFALHAQALKKLGVNPVPVKSPDQLEKLNGLIIPGGESTSLLKLAEPLELLAAIEKFARSNGNIFGTCAGAILLAGRVTSPEQKSLGLIDITIARNAYGRQLQSMEARGKALPPLGNRDLDMVFIRAPRITSVGSKVAVLAEYQDEPVLVQQNNMLAATFHPELSEDPLIYRHWLKSLG